MLRALQEAGVVSVSLRLSPAKFDQAYKEGMAAALLQQATNDANTASVSTRALASNSRKVQEEIARKIQTRNKKNFRRVSQPVAAESNGVLLY